MTYVSLIYNLQNRKFRHRGLGIKILNADLSIWTPQDLGHSFLQKSSYTSIQLILSTHIWRFGLNDLAKVTEISGRAGNEIEVSFFIIKSNWTIELFLFLSVLYFRNFIITIMKWFYFISCYSCIFVRQQILQLHWINPQAYVDQHPVSVGPRGCIPSGTK